MKLKAHAPLRFVKSDRMQTEYPSETLSNAAELREAMQFVEQLFPDSTIVMCQRADNPRVQYVTPNCHRLFGMDTGDIYAMSLPEFLSLAHPDDIACVHQCFAFINDMEPYDPTQYRFTLHYRIRHREGHYISVTDEKFALKGRNEKFIYLNMFRDVSSDEKFYGVRMHVRKNIRGEFKKIQTYIPRTSEAEFTPRQKDIANLVSQGFSNGEIARRLSVSINTVKNHKTLLYRKVNVKSAVELSAQWR